MKEDDRGDVGHYEAEMGHFSTHCQSVLHARRF